MSKRLKLALRATGAEGSNVAFAIADVDIAKVARLAKWLRGERQKANHVQTVETWDGAEFYDYDLTDAGRAVLDKLLDKAWFVLPDDFTLPDEPMSTVLDVMRVSVDCVRWTSDEKHADVDVTTDEVTIDDLMKKVEET